MSRTCCRESSIVASIVRALRRLPGLTVRKRHGTVWGVAGDPDLYGSIHGRHFEIEVKTPRGKPTPLQQQRLGEWETSGALAGIARSVSDARRILGIESGDK
jgi:hypothetical protein